MAKSSLSNPDHLKELFSEITTPTIEELKKALGTNSRMTVFRKLSEQSYISSYSHRGKYYALVEKINFDKTGLWSCGEALFSRYGTLMETIKAFIDKSEMGYSANELKGVLSVEAKEPLYNLILQKRIVRKKSKGIYIYFSVKAEVRKRQEFSRNKSLREDDKLKTSIILFFCLLDEKQKRLYAGLESMKIGYGGDMKMASVLGLHVNTVTQGRKELLSRDSEIDRIRKKGGGRQTLKKST
ncbi:MAG: hypothetical protein GY797_25900 [Deltaproteobacteria bacterium]|nr:hypothetical protein [Deltaproteobacteria bacterium]